MADKKKIVELYAKTIFYIFFILLPLGQLIRSEVMILGTYISVHPIDIVAAMSLPFLVLYHKSWAKIYGAAAFALFVSFIFSLSVFEVASVFQGSLYLGRVICYMSFGTMVSYLIQNQFPKIRVLKTVIYSIIVLMVFGWIQYFVFFDLRSLLYLGFDDHYYRLTSTLFDPPYTSLIFIIGLIIILKEEIFSRPLRIVLFALFSISTLFTYSRAGIITLLLVLIFDNFKKFRNILVAVFVFTLLVAALPRFASSGTELERIFSVYSRLDNYKETFQIFLKYPVFGIGFNNICEYKFSLGTDNVYSHSCSGSDSSILLLLSTTGVIGFLIISNSILIFLKTIPDSKYKEILKFTALAILISSFFNNTIFYNSVMGIVVSLVSVSTGSSSDS